MSVKEEIFSHFELRRRNRLFVVLGGFFITNAMLAEFIGAKIFSVEKTLGFAPMQIPLFGETYGFNMTAGVLLWPFVFIMTDIINEYFGKNVVRRLSYLAIGLILYAFVMVALSMQVSPSDWWIGSRQKAYGISNMDNAYNAVFGQGLSIIIGSVVAFFIGQIVDVAVFHRLRKVTNDKLLWLRATGSTLVSQLIDSFVVLVLAFYLLVPEDQRWSLKAILAIGIMNYCYKFVVALLLTPLLYFVHRQIDAYLGKSLAAKMMDHARESD